MILLDNGFALNVCPLATAIALGYGPIDFESSTQTVIAYDCTRREVMSTLTLELMIGPISFQILFQVLRIPVSLNLLLRRPWIHSAGVIPYSLHLKVKFIHDGRVITLTTVIALGYGPTDFEPSTQTVRAYDCTHREVMATLTLELMSGPVIFQVLFKVLRISVSFNLLLGRPWIYSACAIPYSLHLKVKFIHDGQVITISSTSEAHLTSEPVLEISHGGDDLLLIEFTFDEVQTLELGDFVKDSVPMSFDQHSSPIVLDMIRCMLYMPGLGLGRHQHGRSEFITVLDHDPPFGLGFVPIEADFLCMAQLRQERVRSRLHHIPFDYLVRPYNLFVSRILSLFVTVISLCIVLYDLNRVAVMIQTGPTIYVCCSNCIPYRHAYLSIYLVGHKQAISFITFSIYIPHT